MKHRLQYWSITLGAFCIAGSTHLAFADTAITSEVERIFNWAENKYPELFPNHQATQIVEPWVFRFYPAGPSGGIYVGTKENEIFVLGGPWGMDNPTYIDTVPNLAAYITASGENSSIPACDAAKAPSGIMLTQSGNVVNVTTNGQCVSLPENSNFCEIAQQSSQSGVSLLNNTTITSYEVRGIEIDWPGIPNPVESFAESFATSRHCTINAPVEAENQMINMNICLEMTEQFSSLPSEFGITINPPITLAYTGTTVNQLVSDCFATDAATITNAFTGEFWIRSPAGHFEKMN